MNIPRRLILCALLVAGLASRHTVDSATEGTPPSRLVRTNVLVHTATSGTSAVIQSVDQWAPQRSAILQAMQSIMGPLPGPEKRTDLDLRLVAETDAGDFLRRQVAYSPEPGARVTAYLLVPKRALAGEVKAPAVLALHQTHPRGAKVVVGLGQSQHDEYGVELARRGYVVLAPPYPLLADYQPDLRQLGYVSGTMKAVWDNMRGLDLLTSLPFVKTNGFGAIGHSLGGHNAVFTAAFDERIQIVVSSCGLDSFLDYMDGQIAGWTSARYMPRLRAFQDRLPELPFDFPEVLAVLAPRVCLLSAPRGDTNFKWRSVQAVAAAARPVFALHGMPESLRVEHPDCGHVFPPALREKAYAMLDEVLR
jgi:hypothetical protein